MKKLLKIVFSVIAAIALVLVLAYFFLPWQNEVEKRIKQALEDKGFTQVEVILSALDTHHLALSHLAFSNDDVPVTVENITFEAQAGTAAKLLHGDVAGIKGVWNIASVAANWQGGKLAARDITIAPGKAASVNVRADKIPLEKLLKLTLSEKATATGAVSGTVPLTLLTDGNVAVGNGALSAEGSGVVSIPPELIAGESAQMDIVRLALSNFHYTNLTLATLAGKGNSLNLRLDIEGNNPEAFSGRQIKLHVNFTGDLLNLLRQSILPIMNPKTLMEQTNE